MKKWICLLLLVAVACSGSNDSRPFEDEIQAFEVEDDQNGYQSDFILFVGSSSIRLWESLNEDMKGLDLLNRGFGGAKLSDLNFYWDRILGEHQPKLVVLYCGENDLQEGSPVDETFNQFKVFQSRYQKDLEGVPLIYIAMKPSPSRWEKWKQFRAADRKIMEAIAEQASQKFIDLSPTMLLEDDSPDPEIFLSDDLHMNREGYRRWTQVLRPLIEEVIR